MMYLISFHTTVTYFMLVFAFSFFQEPTGFNLPTLHHHEELGLHADSVLVKDSIGTTNASSSK
jgi:hypothetical protein